MAELQHTRLHAGLYALAALLLVVQAAWFYLVGDYDRILLPALLAPLLITAALMRLGQPETARLSAYLVLVAGYLLVAMELPGPSSLTPFWLGLPPVLTLLLLPLGSAMLLNLTLAPVWLLLADAWLTPDLALGYLALVVVAGLAPWEILHQRALLQATDPMDEECDAMRPSAMHDRLHSECERAALLDQRLAVLLIHLPQLEMAREQFGSGAHRALLKALCDTVARCSRDHDLLGREGDADFWLLLPDTSESGALLVRQRLEEALARRILLDTGQLETRLTVCCLRQGEEADAFLQRLQATTQRNATS
ncbi:diguanylate cyclase domain-containing protein [Halomonas sp. A11-A]|uniref:diguanylate cyclase domain-containing protein n=1 Tax=Halomonas sp. A11-A TaxID=2183985 RepID=UPI000D710E2F|nr:diguanylate cyclase [Halomonas sp. A11-A]PWV74894.1 diguanylate cyclase [Halomonas sp. A11-A]